LCDRNTKFGRRAILDRDLARGQSLLALVELRPARVELGSAGVERRARLLRLGEPQPGGLQPATAFAGRLELLLALPDPRERLRELALALLHVLDALGQRPLQRRELGRRLDALPAQGVTLRLDVGGLLASVEQPLQAHWARWYFS
jgi:hypothetical protein